MARFAMKKIKHEPKRKFFHSASTPVVEESEKIEENVVNKDNTVMMMDTNEKIALANEILSEPKAAVKKIKKDKGLIERVESSKIILTEDNKELLND